MWVQTKINGSFNFHLQGQNRENIKGAIKSQLKLQHGQKHYYIYCIYISSFVYEKSIL